MMIRSIIAFSSFVGCILLAAVMANGFISTSISSVKFHSQQQQQQQQHHSGVPVSLLCRFATAVASFKEVDNDNNPKDPSTWHDDLPPEVFAEYFARTEEFPLEKIREMLKAYDIKNLQDMKELRGSKLMYAIVRSDEMLYTMVTALNYALSRSRKTPEKVLGGDIVYEASCISENAYGMYSEGAVSAQPTTMATPNATARNTEFSLVLGPSGTGKTLFALRRLPQLACSNNLKECFRVHITVETITELMNEKKTTFLEAVTETVQDIIQTKLTRGKATVQSKNIDLYLHVTIDEAGGESSREYFSSSARILRIVDALKGELVFSFIKGVHVTVAGTGLDETTSAIVSKAEATKFRMKPWTLGSFESLVDASEHPHKEMLKSVVRRFAILRDLITNGRCAFFVLMSTYNPEFLENVLLRGFVNVLVSAVANQYIKSNGMKSLRTSKQKWEVCRSVWRQVDEATSQPNVAFLPKFDDIQDETARNAAKLLMEVHVELSAGQPVFLDETCPYSLSVSPALAIVMARLLNADGALSWNWQGFETVVMLSEMKRVVANSQDIPRNPGRPIIELSSPLPKANISKMISVPIVNRYSVVLNGDKASYADVIAPYRLVQAKFSTDGPTANIVLDLTEELDKMGLLITNENNCVLQQKLTSSLYHMWETLEAVPPPVARSIPFEKRPADDVRSESYPFNTLTTPESIEDIAAITYDARLRKFLFATEDADNLYASEADRAALIAAVKAMTETGPLVEFNEHRPITAVFATNGASFRVPKTNVTAEIFIERKDVDWQGRVMKSIPELSRVLEKLRKHVEVRFQFY